MCSPTGSTGFAGTGRPGTCALDGSPNEGVCDGKGKSVWRLFLVFALALTGAACASVPAAIDRPPDAGAPTPAEAADHADQHIGREVRWGGTITSVENAREQTLIEIVARPLDVSARPRPTDTSEGRFLAVVPGFLDPAIYREDRELTVTGRLSGVERRRVGEFDYPYPRVAVTGHHLWPERIHYRHEPSPYGWHDPWYAPWWHDPWYPYHRYPRRW